MVHVKLYFGISHIDRTGDNMWDSEFVGNVQFDTNFNMATVKS